MANKHPRGLYRLFFIEMWERLAFYTMLNILLLYATDSETGGLGLSETRGNEIYGFYLAFVYFTPFPGGLLADRFLGYRRAVVIGALLMAGGLFVMSIRGDIFFITGLVGLVLGNGFFKPNISVMVGNLYEAGDPKRDAGFNIFYMGINIGAFAASFLSSGVRNTAGWLWTFRVAGVGLLIGLAILLVSWKVLERADRRPEREGGTDLVAVFVKILLPAFGTGIAGYLIAGQFFAAPYPGVVGFLAGMVPVLFYFGFSLPRSVSPSERPGIRALIPIFVAGGTFFMILHLNGSAMTTWARDATDRQVGFVPAFLSRYLEQDALPSYYPNAAEDVPRPHPDSLVVVADPELAQRYGQQLLDEASVAAIAGSDAGVDVRRFPLGDVVGDDPLERRASKVYPAEAIRVEHDAHGERTISLQPEAKALGKVTFARTIDGRPIGLYVVDEATVDSLYGEYERRFGHPPEVLAPGEYVQVLNPELYQALNALFVIGFTPLVVLFFNRRAYAGRPISTARKVFLGLVLTTASLLVMAVAGLFSDEGAAKVSSLWLVGFYGVVTVAELCLSPMGLSLVTKLTPKRLVGLTMGGWFLATAFGNKLSGFFGSVQSQLSPVNFFLLLAGLASLSALAIRLLLPRLESTLKKYGA